MKFEKYTIAKEIKHNLEGMGFHKTTDIQFKTIPAIMNGEDVLAIAQTGTGKTAAFAIPIVNEIHTEKSSKRSPNIKCLILVPTRELAKQIGHVFSQLCKGTKTSSHAIYGGVEQDSQIQKLAKGLDILIATPGRMFDLISQGHVDISRVRTLVLDEADHMLDMGFIEDIKSIKQKLKQRHQTLFFSATINPTIKKLAYSQVRSNALRIQVSPEKLVSRNITHSIVKVPMDDKRHLLVNFLGTLPDSKMLVFVRTQVRAERVTNHLKKQTIPALALHGGMEQDERERNLEAFRKQPDGVLIATDVSARGIDLPGITHVINYDLPDDPENYVHRVGRTGRGFAKGDAIAFCSPEEVKKLEAIESFLQSQIPIMKVARDFKKAPTEADIESLEISEMLAIEESLFAPKPKKKSQAKKKSKKKPKKKKNP